MNSCCLSILIRQRACQNGVPVTTDQIFSNMSETENITLNFGYTASLSFYGTENILVTIINSSLDVSLKFLIANPGIGVFDLPIDGGNFRVVIVSKEILCNSHTYPNNSFKGDYYGKF